MIQIAINANQDPNNANCNAKNKNMKSAIAAYVSAVINFLKNKDFKFNGSISFLLTADEEGEAFFGTKKVVEWLEKKK